MCLQQVFIQCCAHTTQTSQLSLDLDLCGSEKDDFWMHSHYTENYTSTLPIMCLVYMYDTCVRT